MKLRKDYKRNMPEKDMNKRGQVTIFVIAAVVIVAVVLAIFLFPRTGVLATEVNPSSFLVNCIEPDVKESIEILSRQGGYSEPFSFVSYQGEDIQYLCYTSENYVPCVIQQPMLVKQVEREIKNYVEPRARQCMENLKEEYEKKGYNVQSTQGQINVSVIPGSVNVEFLSPMTITKESSQTFNKFSVGIKSEVYDLLLTATSIVQFESTLGDSETTLYLQYYPDLKIEKIKREGDTIYIVSNIITGESFTFASRSLVWPPGYGN